MSYAFLADLTVALHAAFVLFVVGGQLLIVAGWLIGWQWPRRLWLRALHLGATAYVVLETWMGVPCPLTVLENHWRALAGERAYTGSFVGRWLDRVLFYDAPPWVFVVTYSVFGLLVLTTLLAYPPQLRCLHRASVR